jgi:hypothetical protein
MNQRILLILHSYKRTNEDYFFQVSIDRIHVLIMILELNEEPAEYDLHS